MTAKDQEPMNQPPTQKTRKGVEIPVPKRRDLLDAFKKIVQPKR
jgi:hypothetical protein